MRLLPVALALFHRKPSKGILEVWTQVREDDGPYHGLLEFPGGGIEPGETPIEAAIREVEEEVGIRVFHNSGEFMGVYPHSTSGKVILLNVFLFPDTEDLSGKGTWLSIDKTLSSKFTGKIPGPNHQIIDDLYRSIYSHPHE